MGQGSRSFRPPFHVTSMTDFGRVYLVGGVAATNPGVKLLGENSALSRGDFENSRKTRVELLQFVDGFAREVDTGSGLGHPQD